jgi:hypothetical protein
VGKAPPGADLVEFKDWAPPGFFAKRLRGALAEMNEPVVFLSPVDMFPTHPVRTRRMDQAVEYMKARPNVLRLNVSFVASLRKWQRPVEQWNGLNIVACSEWSHCSTVAGMGMWEALWNRELLMEMLALKPHWNLWEVEVEGSRVVRQKRPDLRSLAVWPSLLRSIDLYQHAGGGRLSEIQWNRLSVEARRILNKHAEARANCEREEQGRLAKMRARPSPVPALAKDPKPPPWPVSKWAVRRAGRRPVRTAPLRGVSRASRRKPPPREPSLGTGVFVRYLGRNTKTFQVMGPESRMMYRVAGRGAVVEVHPEDSAGLAAREEYGVHA